MTRDEISCTAGDHDRPGADVRRTFRRESNDVWRAYSNCNVGGITNLNWQGYYIHNWDIAEYKGHVFVCGYGISGSTNRCETKMFNASPTLKDCNRQMGVSSWKSPNGYSYSAPYGYTLYRRFCAFLPFHDDLFCVPIQPIAWQNVQNWKYWEAWRWSDAENRFLCETNTWDGIAPGVTPERTNFSTFSSGTDNVQLWHPTRFGSRVLYILGGHTYNISPIAGYSAVNVDHRIQATQIDLGPGDIRPFDLFAAPDAVYLTAAAFSTNATVVTNSVWKSTDGGAWTELDRRRYEENWKAGEYRYYSFTNAKSYRYYKIAFTGNNGDAYTQFERLEYYSVNAPAVEPDPQSDVPALGGGGFVMDGGSGAFTVRVGNVREGFYYTAFQTERLGTAFVAVQSRLAMADDAAGGIVFDLDTADRSSLFVKVVVSAAAIAVGTELSL